MNMACRVRAGLFALIGFAVWCAGLNAAQAEVSAEPSAPAVSPSEARSLTLARLQALRTSPGGSGANPVIRGVPRQQWQQIVETGTWRPGCQVGRNDLRRLDVSYVDFLGRGQRGAIVAHRDSVEDLAEIFTWIFDARFPIARMHPAEDFGGDVLASLAANYTSAFNCRKPGQINAPVSQSPHANGRASDINPVQNP